MAVEGFPKQFFKSARMAIGVFERLGSDWIFIGAVPVAAWGRVRATTDADFAVSLDFTLASEVDKGMLDAGFEKESGPIEIPGKRLILSKYWLPYKAGGLGIDVFYTTGYDAGQFISSAIDRRVQIVFHGTAYWTISPEDLIVFKVFAFRKHDLDDVASVLERRFSELDWEYIHHWATTLRIEGFLEQIVLEFMQFRGIAGPLPWTR